MKPELWWVKFAVFLSACSLLASGAVLWILMRGPISRDFASVKDQVAVLSKDVEKAKPEDFKTAAAQSLTAIREELTILRQRLQASVDPSERPATIGDITNRFENLQSKLAAVDGMVAKLEEIASETKRHPSKQDLEARIAPVQTRLQALDGVTTNLAEVGRWTKTQLSAEALEKRFADVCGKLAALDGISTRLEAIDQITRSQPSASDLEARFKGIDARLATAETNLTALVAVAGVSRLPPKLEAFLQEIRTMDFSKKGDAAQLETRRRELAEVINSLSGSQRDSIRGEITLANWAMEAMDLLAAPASTNTSDLVAEYVVANSLNETANEEVPVALAMAVSDRLNVLAASITNKIETLLPVWERPAGAKRSEALILADTLEDDLSEDLAASVQYARLLDEAEDWLTSADRIADMIEIQPDSDQKHRSLVLLAQDGESLQDRFLSSGNVVPKELFAAVTNFATRGTSYFEGRQEEARRRYQAFALERVLAARELAGARACEHLKDTYDKIKNDPGAFTDWPTVQKYSTFRNQLAKETGIDELRYFKNQRFYPSLNEQIIKKLTPWHHWRPKEMPEVAKCLVYDVLVQDLLPIDESLLERPVAALYSEVYEECWKYLEGSDLRIDAAKAAATVRKIRPGEEGLSE